MSSLHIYTFVVSRALMAGAASQAGDADSSWSNLWFAGVRECPPWCSIVGDHSDSASVLLYFTLLFNFLYYMLAKDH